MMQRPRVPRPSVPALVLWLCASLVPVVGCGGGGSPDGTSVPDSEVALKKKQDVIARITKERQDEARKAAAARNKR